MKIFYKVFTLLFLFIFLPQLAWTQIDDNTSEDLENRVTDDESINEETLSSLFTLYDSGYDLNTVTQSDLYSIPGFTFEKADAFMRYREAYGPFLALHELQSIPEFDIPFINSIKGNFYVRDRQNKLKHYVKSGQNALFVKWQRVLEDQKGYNPNSDDIVKYEGSQDRLYLRYQYYYDNKFSIGVTAEKDPGEAFFKGSNKKGFDFYSFHAVVKDLNKRFKKVAIGDYHLHFGQGLMMNTFYGSGKSSLATLVDNRSMVLKGAASGNELNFLRGAATEMRLGKNLTITPFVSYKKIDGTLIPDSLQAEVQEILENINTRLRVTGLHRTESEIETERSVGLFTTGLSAEYQKNKLLLGVNHVYNQYSNDILQQDRPYKEYAFRGNSLNNTSVHYRYLLSNFYIFGETAVSDFKSLATINGIIFTPDKKIDLAILHRYYDKSYHQLWGSAFGESSGISNENGLYLGFILRPNYNWQISAYYDIWRNDWLGFSSNLPSSGNDFLFRVEHKKKRHYNVYLQYKTEVKPRNVRSDDYQITTVTNTKTHQLRLHLSYKLNKEIELRNRAEFKFYKLGDRTDQGVLAYQDLIYKPLESPISLTARYSFFDITGSNARIYTFENDLLYSFYIPSFANKGTRFYINLRYKSKHGLTYEFRWARTKFLDVDVISSGNEEILGNTRTELKAQIRYKF